ncbi:GNAT family N-acetyltransferase [Amycolatopsis sp. cg5]|uniref:GNAT family N-acetyltransferase n=1 Tax=Amycolatopsis sp. cg5 TaxID=3238802 RepID=UPI003525C63F
MIHTATAADIALLPELEDASDSMFTDVVFPPGSIFDELGDEHTVLVAGDPPIGFAVFGPLGDHLHLHQLSVHPDHGRRGVGSALLAATVEGAAAPFTLTTFEHIPWNMPWYLARGWDRFPREEWGAELAAQVEAERVAGLDDLGARVVLRRTP